MEAWDDDTKVSHSAESLGWGVVELATALKAGASKDVPVVVELASVSKKGVSKPTGKVSLTLRFDR